MSGQTAQQPQGVGPGAQQLASNQAVNALNGYTLPGVLHFLQCEWRRFERERNEWDIEKADLKARVSFLEGERRGVENLKTDLLRRVKMLEYALRQERTKFLNLQQQLKEGNSSGSEGAIGQQPPPNPANTSQTAPISILTMPDAALSASVNYGTLGGSLLNFSKGFGHMRSREILKKWVLVHESDQSELTSYLREVGYLIATSGTTSHGGAPQNNIRVPSPSSDGSEGAEADAGGEWGGGIAAGTTAGTLRKDVTITAGRMRPDAKSNERPAARAAEGTQRELGGPNKDISVLTRDREGKSSAKSSNAEAPGGAAEASVDASALEPPLDVVEPVLEEDNANQNNHVDQPPSVPEPRKKDVVRSDTETGDRKEKASSEDSVSIEQMQEKLKLPADQVSKMMNKWENKGANAKRKSPGGDAIPSVVANALSLEGDDLATLSLTEDDVDDSTSKGAAAFAKPDDQKIWRPRVTLRGHMDSVRAVVFHPTQCALLTASEDNTAKLWNLGDMDQRSGKAVVDLEPIVTLRGHTAALTALAISGDGERCFTGSVDATIRAWKLPPLTQDPYAPYNASLKQHTYVGHSDAIWDLKLHPLSQAYPVLASASSDGAIKLWDITPGSWGLKTTLWYNGLNHEGVSTSSKNSDHAGLQNPTTLDWVCSDHKRIAVAYQNSVVKIFDVETGEETMTCRSNETFDGTTRTQINRVLCHPTMPLLITAHEDRYLRLFDLNTGQCTHSQIAHLDAVSALDIAPGGLTVASGGHDCSIRWWDLKTRSCLQEYTSHRKKNDEGVWSVKYHPGALEYMASGGADGVCKLYNFGARTSG
ncbi:hypothetical protein HK104_002052 [Borealophlyctis nickersoniae]|nr:hypothetical protein HK104_002052 [Borealophlyctis nickersoniae]